MNTIIVTIVVPFIFLAIIILLWMSVHLLATRRLGERKQGCKGAVRDAEGTYKCCKGDGSICEEDIQQGAE